MRRTGSRGGRFGSDGEADFGPSLTEERDPRVNTEALDLAAQKVADARLRDAEDVSPVGLRLAERGKALSQLNDQIRPELQIRRFVRRETEIGKDVTAPAGNF